MIDDSEYDRPSIVNGTVTSGLVDTLRNLGDLYGPKGVADIAHELAYMEGDPHEVNGENG